MEASIEILAAIALFTFGVSHIVQPRAWARFFMLLARQGTTGPFIIGFFTLPMGVLIVAFHNVWTGWAAVLTVLGWLFCLKSFIYFVAPQLGVKMLATINEENAGKFIYAGVGLIALSGLCAYCAAVRLEVL